MDVLSNLNFKQTSQLRNLVVHKVANIANRPAPWAGGLVYVESENSFFWGGGSPLAWHPLNDTTGLVDTVNGLDGIDVDRPLGGSIVNIKADVDASTIGYTLADANKGKLKVIDGSIGNTQVPANALSLDRLSKIAGRRVLANVNTTEGNVTACHLLVELDTTHSDHDTLASAKAIKNYVDKVVGGLGSLRGGWNAQTESNFPAASVKKGDYWYITHSGSLGAGIGQVNLDAGDVIIATKDNPSNNDVTDWIVVETNREQATTTTPGWVRFATEAEARGFTIDDAALTPANLGHVSASEAQANADAASATDKRFITPERLAKRTASEGRTGIAAIATAGDVSTGTNDSKIVTPAKLKTVTGSINNAIAQTVRKWFNVSGGSDMPTLNHGLDAKVTVEVFDSEYAKVLVKATPIDDNNIQLAFAPSLNNGSYKACVTRIREAS